MQRKQDGLVPIGEALADLCQDPRRGAGRDERLAVAGTGQSGALPWPECQTDRPEARGLRLSHQKSDFSAGGCVVRRLSRAT